MSEYLDVFYIIKSENDKTIFYVNNETPRGILYFL